VTDEGGRGDHLRQSRERRAWLTLPSPIQQACRATQASQAERLPAAGVQHVCGLDAC
jgi:hypothetical protein